jgi:hypothetical protein
MRSADPDFAYEEEDDRPRRRPRRPHARRPRRRFPTVLLIIGVLVVAPLLGFSLTYAILSGSQFVGQVRKDRAAVIGDWSNSSWSWQFRADGSYRTCYHIDNNRVSTGKWSLEPGGVTLYPDNSRVPDHVRLTFEEGRVIMHFPGGHVNHVLHRTR